MAGYALTNFGASVTEAYFAHLPPVFLDEVTTPDLKMACQMHTILLCHIQCLVTLMSEATVSFIIEILDKRQNIPIAKREF